MSVLLAINSIPLNTDATAVQYTTYLIKFAEYVGKTDDDGSIYAEKECFTDENIVAIDASNWSYWTCYLEFYCYEQ